MPSTPAPSNLAARRLAVGIAGFCSFLNLYAPQALLPMLSAEFGAGAADLPHHDGQHPGRRPDRAVRRRHRRRARPQAGDRRRHAGPHRADPAAGACAFARRADPVPVRAGAGAAAGVCRDGRLHQRGMARARGRRGHRRLHLRLQPRRLCRPLHHRHYRRYCGVALGVCRAGADQPARRARGARLAAARARVRALRGPARVGAANAAAPAQPAPARHLRGGVRRAVRLHRHLHLHQLPPRSPALRAVGHRARRCVLPSIWSAPC